MDRGPLPARIQTCYSGDSYVISGLILRDPTAETTSRFRPRARPLDTLAGKTLALIDIGKMRGDEFLDQSRHKVARGADLEVVSRVLRRPHTALGPAARDVRIDGEHGPIFSGHVD